LLLEMPDGGCASIYIFDDATSLAAADRLVAAWTKGKDQRGQADPTLPISG
jgi:hypothetical protein